MTKSKHDLANITISILVDFDKKIVFFDFDFKIVTALAGTVQLADHGPHGLQPDRRRTPDSLLLMHGLLPTTGQHGGHYDPQPVTRSSE